MLNKSRLITEIDKSCRMFFTESSFFLHPINANRFKIKGNNKSLAINHYHETSEEVNVIKWFADFWVYINIRFDNQNTFISLSVFQGEENDNIKNQLFRAEWDDYNNIKEKHPQPHWHITANKGIENIIEEFSNAKEYDTFVNFIKEEQVKIIDVKKIHFAMNGNWINNDSDIHSLNNEKKIVKWFQGLLSHLKTELEYVK